ncbi:DUF1203 domain-containing protein [Roseomonas sp. CECT 9278]|uniref:DUF1203 domain-containing protein n=1 Tax=Roseomonas sp. CECT 9278 TaxID=2845823 RepID=UPI001E3130C3|nr:DUF1203 domain-containing protein [Roseomonas sp. CECT 9278]CAH0224355.1 hypothetical protein ROS9278_02489 [Roseomonas sp. CECT 9278]
MSTRFRCIPMDADSATRFRATHRDDRGGAVHVRPVDGPGFPCRACLRLGRPGETMLLASWDLPLPQGPYWAPSPVFLHAQDCGGAPVEDALPETVARNAIVSLRHYDAAGMCLYDLGVVVPGEEAEAALRTRIDDPRVAYVNIHTARPGCWLTRVERSS